VATREAARPPDTRCIYEIDMKTTRSGKLAIIPGPPVMTLESLVEQITDENRHDEIRTGKPVGSEVW
jgi:antitoxin component of MazEF toxin-antitoxin module